MAIANKIIFGDNLVVTDEGGGTIRVDGIGGAGSQGPQGIPAYSLTTTNVTQPAAFAGVTIHCVNSWMALDQTVFIEGCGYYQVAGQVGVNQPVLNNLDYPGSIGPGSTIPAGSLVTPSGPIGLAGATGNGVPGVVLRKSTKVGDASDTTATDGVITATGAPEPMRFTASGGLFRLSDGSAAFHDPHAWIPSSGVVFGGSDRTDSIFVAKMGSGGDSGGDPIEASYEYFTGDINTLNVPYCLIAKIFIPGTATAAGQCTITDHRVFVS